jgi:hypothetical protein
MSRKKPKRVAEVRHTDSGLVVPIFMDQDKLDFFADLPGGSGLRDKDGEALKAAVYSWLDKNAKLEWAPIIEVSHHNIWGGNGKYNVGFDMRRFYYAKKLEGGGFVQRRWDAEQDNSFTYVDYFNPSYHFKQDEFILPYRSRTSDRETIYLDYTDEIFEALHKIRETVKELKIRLSELIGSPEGQEHLMLLGATLLKSLPATVDNEEEDEL